MLLLASLVPTAIADAEAAGKSAAGVGLATEKVATKGLGFGADLGRNLREAAIRTGTTGAICGGKVGRNALSALGSAVVGTVSGNLAREIGACYRNGDGDMSWLTHKVCHFVLGGTAAEFTGGDFLAGGTGAAVGEMVADVMIQRALERTRVEVRAELDAYHAEHGDLPPLRDAELETQLRFQENLIREREALQDRVERYGRLAAAGTALIGRMDIECADAAAQTAIENNAVPSIDVLIENQGRSLVDQLLAYNRAEIEEDVVEMRADAEAAVFFEPAITFLCPAYELAKLGIRHYAFGEAIPTSELAMAGLCILPVGKGCAVVSKEAFKVAARVTTKIRPAAWNRTTKFEGVVVHQRDSFIDPKYISPNPKHGGKSNFQRMQEGLAPIGPDGKPMELHHVLQTPDGPLVEITKQLHTKYKKQLHINPDSWGSAIDRSKHAKFRSEYWKERAKDFEEVMKNVK